MPKENISLGLFPNSATSEDVIRFPKLDPSDLRNLKLRPFGFPPAIQHDVS